jgi:hypothetical protein
MLNLFFALSEAVVKTKMKQFYDATDLPPMPKPHSMFKTWIEESAND